MFCPKYVMDINASSKANQSSLAISSHGHISTDKIAFVVNRNKNNLSTTMIAAKTVEKEHIQYTSVRENTEFSLGNPLG